MKHFKIRISGKVQRVGFRFSAMQVAYRFGVLGFIQNMKDESVYIEAEGDENALTLFVGWCHKGPLGAKVENVEVSAGEMIGFKSFDIISSRRHKDSK
ncbi:MAG: acylphosphatase [Bacteroidota bacterium]